MSERKRLSRTDWLGIALFALGSAGAVVMLLSMSANGPLEQKGPLGAFAAAWMATLGLFPSLFLNAAVAFLGARLFLEIGERTMVRNLLGCAGLALALAVVCGAWQGDAGGWVGRRTGAVVSEFSHVAVGTLLGLVAFFAVAWFAWFRGSAFSASDAATAEVGEAHVGHVLQKPASKIAARPAVHKTTAANEGVSAAESAALFPVDEPVVVKKLTPEEAARAVLAPQPTAAIPPSPYPEDVRKKGQIPAGARPLETPHAVAETAQGEVPPSTVYRWTAPRHERAGDGAGAHLAAEAAREQVPAAAREPDVDEAPEREESPELSATRGPASPSWETPAIPFEPEPGDEEPVDAYGTPLTLIEKLRAARREAGLEGPAVTAPEERSSPDVDREPIAAAGVPRELDADIPGEPFQASEVDLEPLEVDALDLEDEDALELEPAPTHEHDAIVEDEVGIDGSLAGEETVAEEDIPVDAQTEVPDVEAETRAPSRSARAVAEQQKGLFDAVPEREVVLQPVPAAAPVERATKDPIVEADTRTKLLAEIGCLFIERGRVAVSMLQRQYEMDFDEACKVLDDLQDMGLIGPYLGGQRRDILLSREQWLERVGQAGAAR